MSELRAISIWPVETGILPIPKGFADALRSSMATLRAEIEALEASSGSNGLFTKALEEANREYAIETGVIENLYDLDRGTTETLILQGLATAEIAHGRVSPNPEFARALILDHREGLDMVFSFIKSERSLTVGFIKELHALMTRSQSVVEAQDIHGNPLEVPLIHGDWKVHPNNPVRGETHYTYCPPEHVASEMDRLVGLASGYLASELPTELVSAWLHHRFVQIHPFQDGNGRIARALSSIVQIKAGFLPLIVPRDKKVPYLDSLELADAGNLVPLCSFVSWMQELAVEKLRLSIFSSSSGS